MRRLPFLFSTLLAALLIVTASTAQSPRTEPPPGYSEDFAVLPQTRQNLTLGTFGDTRVILDWSYLSREWLILALRVEGPQADAVSAGLQYRSDGLSVPPDWVLRNLARQSGYRNYALGSGRSETLLAPIGTILGYRFDAAPDALLLGDRVPFTLTLPYEPDPDDFPAPEVTPEPAPGVTPTPDPLTQAQDLSASFTTPLKAPVERITHYLADVTQTVSDHAVTLREVRLHESINDKAAQATLCAPSLADAGFVPAFVDVQYNRSTRLEGFPRTSYAVMPNAEPGCFDVIGFFGRTSRAELERNGAFTLTVESFRAPFDTRLSAEDWEAVNERLIADGTPLSEWVEVVRSSEQVTLTNIAPNEPDFWLIWDTLVDLGLRDEIVGPWAFVFTF